MKSANSGSEIRDLEVWCNPIQVGIGGKQAIEVICPCSSPWRYGSTSSSVIVIVDVIALDPDCSSQEKIGSVYARYFGLGSK